MPASRDRLPSFDSSGYRQPQTMAAFVLRRIDRPLPLSDDEVRVYAFHLVATARENCPFVDSRIANALANAQLGGNLGRPGGLEAIGMQGIAAMAQMLMNPDRFVADAMRQSNFEGDARADIITFMQRHGCTNEINIPLAGALHFFQNPPSQFQAQMRNARSAAQRMCTASFDDGERVCACLDRALGDQVLRLEDWQALGSSFDRITQLSRERSFILSALRQCRG
jgi:hypothetical protein